MQKDRFIGTWTLLYAVFLVISAYVAFWNRFTLEEVALRYNKIILNFEIWRFVTSLFFIGYPTPYALLFIWILICHLRTYEDNPVIVAKDLSIPINFAVSVLYAAVGFWITCLFYPLYYGAYFMIMTLLTIDTRRNPEATTDILGFSVKRKVLPFAYAFITLIVHHTTMNEIFAIAWGSLFLKLCRGDSPFSFVLDSTASGIAKLAGKKKTTYISQEKMRDFYARQYSKQ